MKCCRKGMFILCISIIIGVQVNYAQEVDVSKSYPYFSDMIQALHDAQTLYYTSEVTTLVNNNQRSCIFKVWLKKPNFARIECYRKSKLYGTMIGDGVNFWFFWEGKRPFRAQEDPVEYELTKLNSYCRFDATPGRHSLWHKVSRIGCGKIAFQPSWFHKCQDPLDPDIDSVIIHGKEKINDEICDFIEVSYYDLQRSRFYWLGEDDHLPRKIKEVIQIGSDLSTDETWHELNVNKDIPDSLFIWYPPRGWTELFDPSLDEKLVPVGTIAPDFSFQTMEGEMLTLSGYRGKIVLLNFWRVGCPSCREELPILEELYCMYKDKDFVVIGFNVEDKEEYVHDLLKEYHITYPNIYNTSESARKVQFEQYQKKGASAVPLNYIIDRDGKVAMAWYGWKGGRKEKIEALFTLMN